MRSIGSILSFLAIASLAACSGDIDGLGPVPEDASADGTLDATTDAAIDSAIDSAVDSTIDSGDDTAVEDALDADATDDADADVPDVTDADAADDTAPEDASDAALEDASDAALEDASDAALDDASDATPEDASDAAPDGASDGGSDGSTTSVSYAVDVQPIFQAKCSPCHAGGASGESNHATSYADTQLDSYYCAGKKKGECTIVRIKDGSMPMGAGCTGDPTLDVGNAACVTAAEQATIQAWIAAGTPP